MTALTTALSFILQQVSHLSTNLPESVVSEDTGDKSKYLGEGLHLGQKGSGRRSNV